MPHTDANPGDSALVRSALTGDVKALGALIERHFGAVFAIASDR